MSDISDLLIIAYVYNACGKNVPAGTLRAYRPYAALAAIGLRCIV